MTISLKNYSAISDIPADVWNQHTDDYPFAKHEFLNALEISGCLNEESGWQPNHFVVCSDEAVIAVIPAYLKYHSYGEYVFDWAWADAYQRHGIQYYPKLILAVPFTPCHDRRIFSEKLLAANIYEAIAKTLEGFCEQYDISSGHVLFTRQEELNQWKNTHWQTRIGVQYHWFNHGYNSYYDYLARCSSRKRKELRKERKVVHEQGFHFEQKADEQLTEKDWQQFYQFYKNTYLKRSGHTGYLNEEFFLTLGSTMAKHCLMVTANVENTPVAAALNFKNDSTLYGRYWGCLAEFDKLHFETCYYQGIDFCIANGLTRFDAGAQGEHKIQRGFEPIETYSAHWLKDPEFSRAVAQFLHQEKQAIKEQANYLKTKLPFKKFD